MDFSVRCIIATMEAHKTTTASNRKEGREEKMVTKRRTALPRRRGKKVTKGGGRHEAAPAAFIESLVVDYSNEESDLESQESTKNLSFFSDEEKITVIG
eukprot:scaffold43838_cov68-Attheya_sp.AAC.4